MTLGDGERLADDAADDTGEVGGREGLVEEGSTGVGEEGLECGVRAGGAGGEDHAHSGMLRADTLDQFAAPHFGHGDVRQDEIDAADAVLRDDVEGIKAVLGLEHLIAQ